MATVWANLLLLDRLITTADGVAGGMVDDLELSYPDDGPPEVTALLTGPTALGARIGDSLGTWWIGVGRRLRATGNAYPGRVPLGTVDRIDARGITVRTDAARLHRTSPDRLGDWLHDKVVTHVPGNGS